jgi:hypothetical protein
VSGGLDYETVLYAHVTRMLPVVGGPAPLWSIDNVLATALT